MNEPVIQLAHGGGGQMSAELLAEVILPALGGEVPARELMRGLTDSAVLEHVGSRIAFTTDSYVVQPLEFPGGDIGKLAICGTVNDLAVAGAAPRALSLALVLAEGLAVDVLRRVLRSAADAAREASVSIVTGDTKVVERGALDGMVINTAGLGEMLPQARLGFERIGEGDRIVLSGPLGEHGLAVMCRREGLGLASELQSDCAAIHVLTGALLAELGADVHFMRDPTRGGLAAILAEIAQGARRDIEIDQRSIPTNPTAVAAAEILGLDLLTVANEGKLVAVVSADSADRAAQVLAKHGIASQAAVIGTVAAARDGPLVEMVTHVGGRRVVQMPYGEELPRIC
ncbi:MAG TPA: hydrogenase expression/formation protein HypE [Phycisphaerae bacterium]|nr:hydrogenase expression/formation protein HypE [Phycisphaerae bacterium]